MQANSSTPRNGLLLVPALLLCLVSGPALLAEEAASPSAARGPHDVLAYISAGWDDLTRSMTHCETVKDPKLPQRSVLYLPAGFPVPQSVRTLEKNCPGLRVEHLPEAIRKHGGLDLDRIRAHGLLYLENKYVVPGGRFNEMYGWDSYFILLGLLRDGRLDLARGIVENFLFEVDHYGAVLNANRTYYLTRSQPPFLTSMILAVYEAEKTVGRENRDWLARAYPLAVKDYEIWVREPHRAGETGLARYFDHGQGPVPEEGQATEYYRDRVRYFLRFPGEGLGYVTSIEERPAGSVAPGPFFPVHLCRPHAATQKKEECELVGNLGLSADFYKGDRSMRESGFDISFRFGPFSAATHHYAPVCLNSLLYKAEKDLEQISRMLGREPEARQWQERAEARRQNIQKHLWNEALGLFVDYNLKTESQSAYEFATTFYPLWVGLASPEQARALVKNLALFEQPGGLAMSRKETKTQWDYPYGWAPIHLIAVEGLRRYGYDAEADRISYAFLSTVAANFRRDGTIREKYNVVTRSSETDIQAGYKVNVIGFGWTNGVFLELLAKLPEDWTARLAAQPAPAGESVAPPKKN